MKRWAFIQICLVVVVLVGGATASLAAECSSDPNECTPKNLCEVATQMQDGNKLWSTDTTTAKHVSFAQGLGMNCGVVQADNMFGSRYRLKKLQIKLVRLTKLQSRLSLT